MKTIKKTLFRNTFFTSSLFVLFYGSILSFSCKKSNQDDLIPNVPVNVTIYLSLPEYVALNSILNYAIVSGGYRGIIVFRKSLDEFVAFDLACPYDPNVTGAKLQVDSSGITTVDPNCGSKFSLYDGSILHGPATRSMKPYQAVYEPGSNSVFISN